MPPGSRHDSANHDDGKTVPLWADTFRAIVSHLDGLFLPGGLEMMGGTAPGFAAFIIIFAANPAYCAFAICKKGVLSS